MPLGDLGLEFLHRLLRLGALDRQREQQNLQGDRQENNRPPIIAGLALQPIDRPQNQFAQGAEQAEIHSLFQPLFIMSQLGIALRTDIQLILQGDAASGRHRDRLMDLDQRLVLCPLHAQRRLAR